MSSPNSVVDFSSRLEVTDSEILNMGFADFVKKYQRLCKNQGGNKPELEKEKHKSEIVPSQNELSIKKSSLTTIGPVPATGHTKPCVDDTGFNHFLDEWTSKGSKDAKRQWKRMSKKDRALFDPIGPVSATIQAKPGVDDTGFNSFLDEWTSKGSEAAKRHWKKMSKRDRALYAPKASDISFSASTERFGKASRGTIKQACERVCGTHKCRLYLRKRPQFKKYLKSKSIKKWSKNCPKVKSAKCPKPKSDKKFRKPKDSDKMWPTTKLAFRKFFTK